MKSIILIATLASALSLCNLTERLVNRNESPGNQSKEEIVKRRITELFDLCSAGKSVEAEDYLKEPKEAEGLCRRIKATLDESNGYDFGKSTEQGQVIAWEVYFKRGPERNGQIFAFAPENNRYVLVDIDPISNSNRSSENSSTDVPPPPNPSNSNSTGTDSPGTISGGVLNGKATSLPKPVYPPVAKAAGASGTVVVEVTVDEAGKVVTARAVSGHPLLQASAVQAAYQARFTPTLIAGKPVKVTGTITYNFQP